MLAVVVSGIGTLKPETVCAWKLTKAKQGSFAEFLRCLLTASR
jgi:hypothetical protein